MIIIIKNQFLVFLDIKNGGIEKLMPTVKQ